MIWLYCHVVQWHLLPSQGFVEIALCWWVMFCAYIGTVQRPRYHRGWRTLPKSASVLLTNVLQLLILRFFFFLIIGLFVKFNFYTPSELYSRLSKCTIEMMVIKFSFSGIFLHGMSWGRKPVSIYVLNSLTTFFLDSLNLFCECLQEKYIKSWTAYKWANFCPQKASTTVVWPKLKFV